jgi:NAD(P)-dependent dehydrogenase (short-subunit alcohol dehydrogenase family)
VRPLRRGARRTIKATTAAYGPVDILVNNAAITYFIPVDDF